MHKKKFLAVVFTVVAAFSLMSCSAETEQIPGGTPQIGHQFSYAYPTEIAYNNQPGFALNPAIDEIAYALNKNLNQSIFFDSALISDAEATRAYHVKKKPCSDNVGRLFEVETDDGLTLGCTIFYRGSDTLLVVGHGFTNERENLSPFIDMFPDYDVVLFDFRGHGYVPFSFTNADTWPLNFTKTVFGVNPRIIRFGQDEDKDVCAVIRGCKSIKQYRRVFGLGVCYSAFIFLKTAAQHPGMFDKLVLDGCWLSLPLFFDKIRNDLATITNPQTGGYTNHWFFGRQCVKDAVVWFGTQHLGFQIDDVSLLDYVPRLIKVPLLFFHCRNDYMVKRHEFEQLWDALKTEKNVVLTSNHHVRNHLKQKELYKLVCDLFFELSQEQFIAHVQDPVAVTDYYQQKLTALCQRAVRRGGQARSVSP